LLLAMVGSGRQALCALHDDEQTHPPRAEEADDDGEVRRLVERNRNLVVAAPEHEPEEPRHCEGAHVKASLVPVAHPEEVRLAMLVLERAQEWVDLERILLERVPVLVDVPLEPEFASSFFQGCTRQLQRSA